MMESHSSAAIGSANVGVERIPLFTLDSVAPQYLATARNPLLKIDTQGFEWQVLDGARNTLPWRARRVVRDLAGPAVRRLADLA
jgi:FkbM family methyltransferase